MVSENATKFLDFYDIFVNQISGTEVIFLAASSIIIIILAVIWRFEKITLIGVLTVWFLAMASENIGGVLPLLLTILSYIIASQINKFLSRT